MADVLGHDIDGRPLRAGDLCVTTGKPGHPFNGKQCTISEHKAPIGSGGELVIEVGGNFYAFNGCDLRKLKDDHRPATESFREIINKLKSGEPA